MVASPIRSHCAAKESTALTSDPEYGTVWENLASLAAQGTAFLVQYTVTRYPRPLEPLVVSAQQATATALLAGAVIDRSTRPTILLLEAERRLNNRAKLTPEARVFTHINARDALARIKNDDVLIARLSAYF